MKLSQRGRERRWKKELTQTLSSLNVFPEVEVLKIEKSYIQKLSPLLHLKKLRVLDLTSASLLHVEEISKFEKKAPSVQIVRPAKNEPLNDWAE